MNLLPPYASRHDRELESYCRSEGIDLWALLHRPKAVKKPAPAAVTLTGPRPCQEAEGRCEDCA